MKLRQNAPGDDLGNDPFLGNTLLEDLDQTVGEFRKRAEALEEVNDIPGSARGLKLSELGEDEVQVVGMNVG